jgi:hypothetical protein
MKITGQEHHFWSVRSRWACVMFPHFDTRIYITSALCIVQRQCEPKQVTHATRTSHKISSIEDEMSVCAIHSVYRSTPGKFLGQKYLNSRGDDNTLGIAITGNGVDVLQVDYQDKGGYSTRWKARLLAGNSSIMCPILVIMKVKRMRMG